jgi:hypothetical protein
MKAYVVTTGVIFAILVVVHFWRIGVEPHLARDPAYWLITAAAGAMSIWAWLALRRGV